jgi:hypothetical protein
MKNNFLLLLIFLNFGLHAQREADCLVGGYCLYFLPQGCEPPYGSTIYKFDDDGIEYIEEYANLNLSTDYSRAAFSDHHTGELLFASNGWRLVNRSGQVLAHKLYNNDIPHPGGTPDTTAVLNFLGPLFLNDPGDSTKAYLFYGQSLRKNYAGIGQATLDVLFTYAYLDIPTQSLISKGNVVVDEPTAPFGGMAACRHANGRDWWLVKLGAYLDDFYIGLVSPQGVNMQKITYPLMQDSLSGRTWTYFNQDGTKMLRFASSYCQLHSYDFDRCSGVLSNLVVHDLSDSLNKGLGVDWNACNISPDGTKFYVRRSSLRGGGTLQYNLETSEYTYITNISTAPQLTPNYKQILLADRYFTENDSMVQTICTINNPNESGLGCNFVANTDTVINIYNLVSPSCFANFRLGPLKGSPCDTIVSGFGQVNKKEAQMKLYPNPARDVLYMEFPYQNGKPYTIQIIDAIGRVVYAGTLPCEGANLPLAGLPIKSGLYVLQASRDGKVYNKRFVVER